MTLDLTFKGYDSWDRPVYECSDGKYEGVLLVDVDPREHMPPDICTKYNNEFDGEPDSHVKADIIFNFIPKRITW